MSTRSNYEKYPVCGREGVNNNLYADQFNPEEHKKKFVCIFCKAEFMPCSSCQGTGVGDYPYGCQACGSSGIGSRLTQSIGELL